MSFFLRFFALACLPLWARANVSSPAAAPSSSLMSIAQVTLALAFVIGLILLSAWLVRRLSLLPMSNAQTLRVVSGVMVGSKERVVVVEVEGRWLVLGVTASAVNLLHTLDAPEQTEPVPLTSPFAARLATILQRKTS
ncbi:flagellar biosynthetic protein FliO [Iodobacter fluviatilis]|uniref:Flagellar protein n=1 Tax=Iodobacter fluviatilis TaxID=537 RepID=A0A377SU76_9NEIS|nr:flagellar biosynthetic protein FliO [Iodobacter fluviatilis]TCU88093.1 flagellar protein FliO/FliZ [Iodobacter fluviatilis]STR45594.1 Flagellar protein fliO [Iodobacter fluviatilis]